MKKFVNWILKTLIHIIIFIFVLFLTFIICTYIFSQKNDISVKDTLAHFQAIGNEFIDITLTDKNSTNITLDTIESNITTSKTLAINYNKNNYYYNQLDDTSKTIYDKLESNIDNLKNGNYVIHFNKQFNDLLHNATGQYQLNKSFQSALDAFFYDHPEIFYIDLTKMALTITSTSLGPLTTYTVKIEPKDNKNYLIDCYISELDVNNAISKVETIKNNAINEVINDNDYNKILKIHNMLVNSIEYNSSSDADNSHNIYGALINRKTVCEGYAKSFKYILDSLNIECILVSGTATNSSGETESHMWNYVKLNDNWYGVDVTWDDPIIIGGSTKNNIRYDFLLKGKNTFIKSHSASGKLSDAGMLFKLPSLSTENYK